MLDLARTSDVFLQNYRGGVADRLGVDYESIRAIKPDIVYIPISGYGETGPYASRPGTGSAAPGDERGDVQRRPDR